jgi:predicted nucleic acid-binding protein
VIVIDASVAVKWFLPEAESDQATALLAQHETEIAVPDIFVTEVSGALVRRANMDKIFRRNVDVMIAEFLGMWRDEDYAVHRPGPEQFAGATAMAMDLGHPLKDCLYLVLAMELDCDLVTADARFAGKARGAYDGVRVLGE